MSRRRVGSLSSGDFRRPPSSFVPITTYPHVSSYRALQLEVLIYSLSVKARQQENRSGAGPLPVFGDHDQVTGKVILDSSCSHTGRLSISIEGAFIYSAAPSDGSLPASGLACDQGKQKHIFFTSSTTIPVSPGSEPGTPLSAFREVFAASMRKRPSMSSLSTPPSPVERSFPFSFDLPRSCRPGEEMPPTFITSSPQTGPSRYSSSESESFEVSYKVFVTWEAHHSAESPSFLEVPILFHPDTDFQSMDAQVIKSESWLEMPLRSDRPIPFRCAVTLPTSVTFSRASSIPYFVVFTTTPRSSSLAKEIAADATISVSLIRQITVTEQCSLPPTPPQTPSSSNEDSDPPRNKLLKRVVKSTPPRITRPSRGRDESVDFREKPLPRLPTQTIFTESRTLQNSICIGFPKRPRHQGDAGSHPSLDLHKALPDGLHKAKILLDKEMVPCIDWAGLSVKYYLDVSVLIGQDDLRARIPIRIL